MNIPNYLTLLRILLIPILVGVFYLPFHWSHLAAAIIFAIAAFTDWLDGYLARTLGAISSLGQFLDPVADKLLVAVALVLLVSDHHLPYLAVPAAIIIGREIVVSALREWMSEVGKRASVAVSYVGKAKTAIQMFAIFVLLGLQSATPLIAYIIGYAALYLAAGLTLWSMVMYIRTAWPDIELSKS